MAREMYADFHISLETGPHSAIHTAISQENGDMGPFTSPNGKQTPPVVILYLIGSYHRDLYKF